MKSQIIVIAIGLFILGLVASLRDYIPNSYRFGLYSKICTHQTVDASQALPYAVLISTNLVPQNCPCGFCDPSRGIAVPEHINQLGYDLRIEVSTNYLPIVYR